MSFQGVIAVLNDLKKQEIISDYAICGGYAITYYLEPSYTYDLDIIILLNNQEEFHKLYQHFREQGNRIEKVYIYIDEMPVQFFPGYGGDLYENTVKFAHKITVKGVPSKVASIEYLVALLLKSYRPKDKIRIVELLPKADAEILNEILVRFDTENDNLQIRYQKSLNSF